jgi:hypothetical protein
MAKDLNMDNLEAKEASVNEDLKEASVDEDLKEGIGIKQYPDLNSYYREGDDEILDMFSTEVGKRNWISDCIKKVRNSDDIFTKYPNLNKIIEQKRTDQKMSNFELIHYLSDKYNRYLEILDLPEPLKEIKLNFRIPLYRVEDITINIPIEFNHNGLGINVYWRVTSKYNEFHDTIAINSIPENIVDVAWSIGDNEENINYVKKGGFFTHVGSIFSKKYQTEKEATEAVLQKTFKALYTEDDDYDSERYEYDDDEDYLSRNIKKKTDSDSVSLFRTDKKNHHIWRDIEVTIFGFDITGFNVTNKPWSGAEYKSWSGAEYLVKADFGNCGYQFKNLAGALINTNEVQLSNLPPYVTDISYMFQNATIGTNINQLNVSNIKNMSYMFYDAMFKENVSFNAWEVHSVTNMNHMFDGVRFEQNVNLNLNNWNMNESVTINNMFENANISSRARIYIDQWDETKIHYSKNVFLNVRNPQLIIKPSRPIVPRSRWGAIKKFIGFRKKYLKYKTKYLNLKKMINNKH